MPVTLSIKNAPDDVLKEVRRLTLTTPRESAAIVRADRVGR